MLLLARLVARRWIAFPIASSRQRRETVTAIQVHGNTATPDDEVRRLADVRVGMPFDAQTTVDEVAARLRAAKRFEQRRGAEAVRVDRRPVADRPRHHRRRRAGAHRDDRRSRSTRPASSAAARPNIMFLPVLDARGRLRLHLRRALRAGRSVAGKNSRLSFPLTWGGDEEAGAELEKTIRRGRRSIVSSPADRVVAGGPIRSSRRTTTARACGCAASASSCARCGSGATAGWQHVSFVDLRDRFAHAGADVVARHAPRSHPGAQRRLRAGRVGAFGPSRSDSRSEPAPTARRARLPRPVRPEHPRRPRAARRDSSEPLPPYLQPLLGGMANLRGFKAGTAVGDTLVATSAELIVPLTSPLHVGEDRRQRRSPMAARSTTRASGSRIRRCSEGYGGSVWFSAAFLRLNFAVAHGRGASTRVHFGAAASF